MPELHFDEDDGPIQLQMSQGYAVVQGEGVLTYKMPFNSPRIVTSETRKSLWVRRLDKVLRYVTPLLIILVLALAIWYWVAGVNAPSFVSLSAKVFSFALIGSLLSLGGVNLLSLKSQLVENEQHLGSVSERCPFISILEPKNSLRVFVSMRPGNPRFCIKCPLGIDLSSNVEGLIHTCSVYPALHKEWKVMQEQAKRLGNQIV
jgi:hypothetical protein